MDFSAINVGIVILVYCIIEIIKNTACKKDDKRKLLPVFSIIIGVLIACTIVAVVPSWLPGCKNYLDAIGLGGMSGASATGCNQIYRQFTKFSTGASDSSFED